MLLLLESVDNRINFDKGIISQRKRTFANLQRSGKNHRDLLLTLPLNTPTKLDIGPNETATVTLLDANHCPGSVMFLIQGKCGTVLHTGDIRAEPAMQKKQLDAVYLDTASFIGTQVVPSKASAVQGLLDMVGMYPKDTLFYVNIWTWGYEDILVGISERFSTRIHVDRHKYLILCSLEDYQLSPSFSKRVPPGIFKAILTCDEHATRFHACERYNQCAAIQTGKAELKRRTHRNSMVKPDPIKRAVWVNPGVITSSNWESHIQEVNQQLKEGQFVDTLKVPLSRHSTLTELQSLVTLLRPKNVYPTTLVPSLEGLDWACLPGVFARSLTSDGYEALRRSTLDELRKRFPGIDLIPEGMAKRVKQVLLKSGHPDLEQENAFGSDEVEWTEAQFQHATKTKEHIETYLPWLFERQDTPTPAVVTNALLKSPAWVDTTPSTTFSSTVLIGAANTPQELCFTCANCPTCRPKPSQPSAKILEIEVRTPGNSTDSINIGSLSLPKIKSSKAHTIGSGVVSFHHNERMHSPPPESAELRPNEGASSIILGTSATNTSMEPPNKRLRVGSATLPQISSLTFEQTNAKNSFPTLLDRSPTRADFCASLVQSGSNNNGAKMNLETLSPHTPPDDSRKFSGLGPASTNIHQAHAVLPAQTAEHPSDTRSVQNIHHLPGNATISSTGTNSLAVITQAPVLFAESDARERRRISKLKERNIRAQLAKLPPGFSEALAATKSKSDPK
ncbi:unnamed protein product [Rhizoctonia solani]|uniref:Protein artemis n=1 Tax=Rhizoctonia solani TaxID=456999 RepID=A0A8H3AFF5_9AGAM|nr:unnamed protein product [Rhizoctonia solani]